MSLQEIHCYIEYVTISSFKLLIMGTFYLMCMGIFPIWQRTVCCSISFNNTNTEKYKFFLQQKVSISKDAMRQSNSKLQYGFSVHVSPILCFLRRKMAPISEDNHSVHRFLSNLLRQYSRIIGRKATFFLTQIQGLKSTMMSEQFAVQIV